MITAELKDELLIRTVEMGVGYHTITKTTFDRDYAIVQAIFSHFDKKGLITAHEINSYYIKFLIHVDAHDFIQRGGFKFEEEIFRNNFAKLELELQKLERENPTISFENATKLIGAISSGVSVYSILK